MSNLQFTKEEIAKLNETKFTYTKMRKNSEYVIKAINYFLDKNPESGLITSEIICEILTKLDLKSKWDLDPNAIAKYGKRVVGDIMGLPPAKGGLGLDKTRSSKGNLYHLDGIKRIDEEFLDNRKLHL